MTLDRQKIISELGSVMNQLKNTDCGCMGKLFGDSDRNAAQTNHTPNYNNYSHGCCHSYNHGSTTFGGPCLNNKQHMYKPCMGQCNSPQLFSDTYSYLNENLMKPTINEVYNDLKTMTPDNTVMNNSMANQLSLSGEQFAKGNNIGMPAHSYMTDGGRDLKSNLMYDVVKNIPQTNNNTGNSSFGMGGMGPQIVNMFGEKNTSKNMGQQQGLVSQCANSLTFPNSTTASPISHNNSGSHQMYGENQSNNMNSNTQSLLQNINKQHIHGQHAQGIAKFNETFPGLMKNGDLGFDPMSIAIQMNPANQKKVAMDTIQKIMTNNNGIPNKFDNTVNYNPGTNVPIKNTNNQQWQSNITEQSLESKPDNIQQTITNQISSPYSMYGMSPMDANKQAFAESTSLINQNEQIKVQQQQGDMQPRHMPRMLPGLQSTPMIKEPILPADKSRFVPPKQKYYEYNTLGQPIEMLPAKFYHAPEPGLPQTLSPQPTFKSKHNFMKQSNVKSTISKTSIMDVQPIGKTPSRNHLQQIYNNYKGSHSYTQQNVSPKIIDETRSDRKLNIPHVNFVGQRVEKIGGDTLANNQQNHEIARKEEHIVGQIGDAPVSNKTFTNNLGEKSPVVNRKYRNGLQDITYTSYPTSAAWSFHGDRVSRPITGRY